MSLTLTDVSKLTEDQARDTFERIRWPNGPACPHCGSVEATKLEGKAHRAGLYKCRTCEGQFTATVNTILEDSHLPIRTWLMAFAILCSSKKGVSALQLQRQLGLGSYRSAWHMAHRIRHAMSKEPLVGLLRGTVEVDETYVGGKPRKAHGQPKPKKGRGTKKTPVVALVERGGRVHAHKVERVNAKTLKGAIRENVDRSSTIMTDEWKAYHGIGKEFAGGHQAVNHGNGEYVRGDRMRRRHSLRCLNAASSAHSTMSQSGIWTATATSFPSAGTIGRPVIASAQRRRLEAQKVSA